MVKYQNKNLVVSMSHVRNFSPRTKQKNNIHDDQSQGVTNVD
jgi:hypothetical protein